MAYHPSRSDIASDSYAHARAKEKQPRYRTSRALSCCREKLRAESSSGASKPPATYERLIETLIRSWRRFVVRRAPVALSSLAVGLGPTFETLFEMSGGVRCVDDWVPPLCGMPRY